MTIKRIAAGLTATAAVTACLVAGATAASADDCYEVGFANSPGAEVVLAPPKVSVDDGDPYYRISPGSCV